MFWNPKSLKIMKKNSGNRFDAFVQERIKKEGLEKPLPDFTKKVLSRIEAGTNVVSAKNDTPLISKPVWLAIIVVLLVVFYVLLFGNLSMDMTGWPQLTLQKISELNLFGNLPQLIISDTYIYAFIGLALFMGVQVYLLKNHFDKRYFMN